jgi:hypothetical protein
MLKNYKANSNLIKGSSIAKAEHNDCMVKAVSASFGVSYDAAHGFVKETFNRKNREGTYFVEDILNKKKPLGFTIAPFGQLTLFGDNTTKVRLKWLGSSPKLGGELCNPNYTHKKVAYTIKTFLQKYKTGRYLVLVRGHALAVVDGVLVDNEGYGENGYRRPIENAYRVDVMK